MIRIVLFLLFLSALPFGLAAEERVPSDLKRVTPAEMYAKWGKHSPREVVAHAKKALAHIAEQGKGGLAAFNYDGDRSWWPNRPYFTPVIVMRCDELRDVTHPVESFHKFVTTPGIFRKYADKRGKNTFLDLCRRLPDHPEGLWVRQFALWPGVKEPVWMGVLAIQVPDTPYQLHLFYVTDKWSEKALNALLNR